MPAWRAGAAAVLVIAGTTACGSGTYSVSGSGAARGTGAPAGTDTAASLSGLVRSAGGFVAGASVTAYAAGGSRGAAPAVLAHTLSSASGSFQLSFTCAQQAGTAPSVYVVASGGQVLVEGTSASGAWNSAMVMLTALGSCAHLPPSITVTELTTVAAAYALNAFIDAAAIAGSAPGLPNAAATAALLADPSTGALAASLPDAASCAAAPATVLNCETVLKLNAIAGALAACNATANAQSATCAALFACTSAGAGSDESGSCIAPAGVVAPVDTLQAALAITRQPGAATNELLGLAAAGASYAPRPASAPHDWTVSLTHAGGGLSEPTGLAIDATGNVWVANYNPAVTKLSPTGAALSPASGFSGGGLEESFGIAIDASGHVWVCNQQGGASSGLGTLAEFAADGTVLSGPQGIDGGGLNFPVALVADLAGHLWAVNYGNSTLTELSGEGTPLSPGSGWAGGGLSFPVAAAFDHAGDLWVANDGADRLSRFSAAGTATSPAGGFLGGGLAVPQGVAIDQDDHAWITNYYGDSLSEFGPGGTALSPETGFLGGGLASPGGIAIDGAGTVWVANYENATISKFAGSRAATPGAALSPGDGFTSAALLQPFAVAIDASGNLWVTNFAADTVSEFIGIAAPVTTPLAGPPQSPR